VQGGTVPGVGTSGREDRDGRWEDFVLEKLPSRWEGIVELVSWPTKERPGGRTPAPQHYRSRKRNFKVIFQNKIIGVLCN
jgi:hypothetical protein